MSYEFSEAAALTRAVESATVEQLRTALQDVINSADAGGYVDEVRDLKHILWAALTAPPTTLPEDVADASQKPAPEVHAVTGAHHQAGAVRPDPIGRRRAVGFQLNPSATEKENPHG